MREHYAWAVDPTGRFAYRAFNTTRACWSGWVLDPGDRDTKRDPWGAPTGYEPPTQIVQAIVNNTPWYARPGAQIASRGVLVVLGLFFTAIRFGIKAGFRAALAIIGIVSR